MRVLLDTNIFHGHWHLGGASFTYLFHYLNNQEAELLVSDVVRREVNNIQARDLSAALQSAEAQLKRASVLNGGPVTDIPLAPSTEPYDILSLLLDRTDNLVVIPYDTVAQSEVLTRALSKRKPFKESGEGYRDTLIWLSLLEYLAKDQPTERIAFITKNSSDFFDKTLPGKTSLHPNLADDLKQVGLRDVVIPFASLDAFVEATIDKDVHALDYSRIESLIGDDLELGAIAALESRDPKILAVLNESLTPGTALVHSARAIAVNVVEGIEDFTVLSTKDLGNDDVYVRVDFDLRIVSLDIIVPLATYLSEERTLKSVNLFLDTEVSNDSVTLEGTIRPRFVASVIYSRRTSASTAFEVVELHVKV
jgi:hypothetical protein